MTKPRIEVLRIKMKQKLDLYLFQSGRVAKL